MLHDVDVLVLSVEMTYHRALQGVGEAFQEWRAKLHVNDEGLCVSKTELYMPGVLGYELHCCKAMKNKQINKNII